MSKVCRYCKTQRPLAEFNARRASPDGLGYKCRPCERAYQASRPPGHRAALRRASYERRRESERAASLAYYHANRERLIPQMAAYKAANPELRADYIRRNLANIVACTAAYRAALDQRTPLWLTVDDFAAMRATYEECARVTRETGVPHHVDHDYPLRGRTVSGLHVPANLRVVPARVNLSKGNRLL